VAQGVGPEFKPQYRKKKIRTCLLKTLLCFLKPEQDYLYLCHSPKEAAF
jgi:hypothetical protein